MDETFDQWFLLGPEQLELRQVPTPRPGAGELVLQLTAATTCGTDVKVYRRGGHARMLSPPCPFGHEMVGRVLEVGEGTTRFREGDLVVVANSASCGRCPACLRHRENLCEDLQYLNGAFGERLHVPKRFVERSTYPLPKGLDAHVACLAEPLACAVHCLERLVRVTGSRQGTLQRRTLVVGTGPLGLLLVDLFADAGAEVSAVDPHEDRLAVASELGATAVERVDSGGSEPPELARAEAFDIVVEATGTTAAWQRAMASVAPGGHVAFFGGCAKGSHVPLDTHLVHYCEVGLHGVYHHRPATFRRALELLAAGTVDGAKLLTERRPMNELPQALQSMMQRRALKVALEL
ncbi:MAG: alcohol dehydrogenase catalytic domain-containing protein [Acidobacteriota bacterium]